MDPARDHDEVVNAKKKSTYVWICGDTSYPTRAAKIGLLQEGPEEEVTSLLRRVPRGAKAVALLLVVGVGAGVWLAQLHGESLSTQVSSNGPLQLGFLDGEYTTYPPEEFGEAWWGSYGSGLLCVNDGSRPARITGVKLVTLKGPRPEETEVVVRTVTQDDLAGEEVLSGLVLSAYGRSEQPAPPYAPEPVYATGTFSDPAGIEVKRACNDIHPSGGASLPAQEMIISLLTPKSGAVVDTVEVSYDVAGRKYRLNHRFRMIQCGPQVSAEVRAGLDEERAACTR